MSPNITDIQIFAVFRSHCYVNRRLLNYTIVAQPIESANLFVLILLF